MIKNAWRFLSLALCVLLLFGMTAAKAEMITVGIALTGQIPQEDGTYRTVTPEGSFRVFQNGQEIGTIAAGRETLTLDNTGRIRIEPVPQSFAPGWDLSTASLTPDLSGSGSCMIPVTIYALGAEQKPAETAQTPTKEPAQETPEPVQETEAPTVIPTEAPTEIPTEVPATPVPATAAPATEVPTVAPPTAVPATAAPTETPAATPAPTAEPTPLAEKNTPIVTPTLPPYTEKILTTPEPVLPGFSGGKGTGSLQVNVFLDKNANGSQAGNENGVPGITVYLLNGAGEALVSAKTGSDGIASFENIPAGKYRTKVNLTDKWYFTKHSSSNGLGENAYDTTAGNSQTSGEFEISEGSRATQGIGIHDDAVTLKGACWLDERTDGLYNIGGEKVLPGIGIVLQSEADEKLVYETESGADGKWRIPNLRPGVYYISVKWPEGMMITRYTQERGVRSFLTSDNQKRRFEVYAAVSDIYIGFNWATQVYGRCYMDANYNGLYDEGEPPLAGVKIAARYSYDSAEASSTVSREDGTFVLDGLRGKNYTLVVTLPKGGYVYTKTVLYESLGNRFSARGDQRQAELANVKMSDAERREMNIGAILTGTVSGTVYYDDNCNSVLDGKEKTVSGFLVVLRDAEGKAAVSDRSSSTGVFELTGIMPGEYTLDVTAVNGYAFTKRGEGNVILNLNNGAGYSEKFRVEIADNITGMDIGMIRPGTIKGTVFADLNDNGLQDSGEGGLTGTAVRLMSETEGEAFRTEIGPEGTFVFDAVMPGRYYVEYELPESAVYARLAEGGNRFGEPGKTARTDTINLTSGDLKVMPLCGALTLGRIEGSAYQDHDGNGLQENEEALSGLTVRLIPSRQELEEITVMTDVDGTFVLDQLRPDVYQLVVTCPDGYVMSRTDYLTLPLKAGVNEQAAGLLLQMGDTWTDQKIGAVIPAAIRGQLWMDENNNGLFDEGEHTPAGYTVIVTDETTGTVFDTPVTDENGRFSAAGMIPGRFTVSLPMDEWMQSPKAGDSVFTEIDGSLVLSGIMLKENEERDGLLMGVIRTTAVSGHAWIDRGSVIEDLQGVKIVMRGLDGSIIMEAITDEQGNYRFGELMPCEFRLEITAPEGCVIIEPGDRRLSDTLRSVPVVTNNRIGSTGEMQLKMGTDIVNQDIGCVLPGCIGDYCWVDLNKDGLQAGDEPGLPYMRIELLRDGTAVAETTTDQYGFYRFVDIYPATYTLKVYMPEEVKPTVRRTDLKIIASVLRETEEQEAYSIPIAVVSDRSDYDVDLGFVCRTDGVLPAGAGEGAKQIWTPKY